ncbi:SC5A9-like protein [Mya arenaria]|uniref:SC5A9-like protein n=1 Tax=Mya arenaria TaxID=6604 RepID=A0ABY7DZ44_MYAAR|nr:SC5A9-like protein [Mya arenaria]
MAAIGFNKIGGYSNLQPLYMNATASLRNANNTCGNPRDDAFHVLRDAVTSDIPWLGTVLHMLFGSMWYFCCDQVIVQRSLAARSLSHAKAGSLLCAYLKILPMFIMIMPGMISRILYPDEIGCVLPEECERHCGNPVGCSNIAYPKLVLELLPAGLRGLLVAVMLSAIMSSLTSIFNSASTLFSIDIWPRLRKGASQRELLIIICMLKTAAFWSLVIGHVCGVTRMVMDFSLEAPECGEPETRPAILYKVNFTYFGVISFTVTSISILVIKNDEGVTQSDQHFDDDVTRKSSSENDGTRSRVVVIMYKLCGIPLKASSTLDDSKEFLYKETFMKEDPLWKNIININAMIGCLVIAFLMGYFH